MAHTIDSLFTELWDNFIAVTPSAKKIHELIGQYEGQGAIVNDHIALRTLAVPGLRVSDLGKHFEKLGYYRAGEYDFSAKKLNAFHYQHPNLDHPKVFISELQVDALSDKVQNILNHLLATVPQDLAQRDDFLYSGTHWSISSQDYQTLLNESEYAAWFAAWGYRANHFTVSINHLQHITELEQMNTLLKESGFTLNTSGGEIKGGEDVCLAQSSTMADHAQVNFSDDSHTIPSCFYEFAQRYRLKDSTLYQGFVAASADKIFESTNVN
ncbi:MAG: DUF1338 domain-containing protein [Glaciecola sp.]|jgi:hypothetical protein